MTKQEQIFIDFILSKYIGDKIETNLMNELLEKEGLVYRDEDANGNDQFNLDKTKFIESINGTLKSHGIQIINFSQRGYYVIMDLIQASAHKIREVNNKRKSLPETKLTQIIDLYNAAPPEIKPVIQIYIVVMENFEKQGRDNYESNNIMLDKILGILSEHYKKQIGREE